MDDHSTNYDGHFTIIRSRKHQPKNLDDHQRRSQQYQTQTITTVISTLRQWRYVWRGRHSSGVFIPSLAHPARAPRNERAEPIEVRGEESRPKYGPSISPTFEAHEARTDPCVNFIAGRDTMKERCINLSPPRNHAR